MVSVHLVALIALAFASNAQQRAPQTPAEISFQTMTTLVGTWRRADAPESALKVRFALTAGGTTLVETWDRGVEPHSMTIYHRDHATLIATHYCPQGNQPRLALEDKGKNTVIRFVFRDATDLETEVESHLTSLSFYLSKDDVLVRTEAYRHGETLERSELKLVRER